MADSEHMIEKSDLSAKMPTKTPLKKHLSSTFQPMIGQYMSHDQLADHVNRQMRFFHKKYEPPEETIIEENSVKKAETEKEELAPAWAKVNREGSIEVKKSKKKVNFKKSKSSEAANSDEETENEKERQEYREGLRDRMLEDLELLRDYYKRIYKKALDEKVANQHKEFKTRNAQALAKATKQMEKEEQDKHRVIIRLPKSKVLNDQTYKDSIQETVYHKIIKVEHQLKKQGYLSKVSEIKAFWNFILVPGNLGRVLEKGKFSWEEVQHFERTYRSHVESADCTNSKKWTTSDIDKLAAANAICKNWHKKQHSRPRLFTPSGLTDISSSQSRRRLSPLSSNKTPSPVKAASNSALTLEQLFPKVEFPPLAAYSLVFGDQEPDPEEIDKELEIERRETAKRETRTKLLTMFSHALANRAATQRLMDRNQNFRFSQLVGLTPVSELLHHETGQRIKAPPLTSVALKAHDYEARQDGYDDESSISSKSSGHQKLIEDNKSFVIQQFKRLPAIEVSLTLQGLEETCPIKEAKGLSTLWVNPFNEPKKRITVEQ